MIGRTTWEIEAHLLDEQGASVGDGIGYIKLSLEQFHDLDEQPPEPFTIRLGELRLGFTLVDFDGLLEAATTARDVHVKAVAAREAHLAPTPPEAE